MHRLGDIQPETIDNIIVEGIECAGKTTLIDEVRREIPGWDLKFLGHKDGNQFRRYAWEYNVNEGTIFNRAHYSELVYSTLHNRANPFTETGRQILDSLVGESTLVIFCDPEIEDVKERYMQRETAQPVDYDELEEVHGLFKEVFENVPHLKYVSTDMDSRDTFVSDLITIIKDDKEQ